MNRATRYFLGLLIEEMGEALQAIGKAMRFGLDVPGPSGEPYRGMTARGILSRELGDVCAAIKLASESELIFPDLMYDTANEKHEKLINPHAMDNRGRRLAPEAAGCDEIDLGPSD